jgi:hypothetical protein
VDFFFLAFSVVERSIMKGRDLIRMIQDQDLLDHDFCTVDKHEGTVKKSAREIIAFNEARSSLTAGYYETNNFRDKEKIATLY